MMQRKSRKARDTIFWIGTGLSLLAAVVVPLVISVDSTTAALSVFGSWTFFTVLSLYVGQRSLEAELIDRHESLAAAVKDNCATDKLKRLLSEIRENRPHLFHVIAQSSLQSLLGQLERATIGDVEVGNEDRRTAPLRLAEEVKVSLDTTAFFSNDPTSEEYHKLLAAAIADPNRKVEIRRLFLISSGVEQSKPFKDRLKKDRAAGVGVRYLFIENWIGGSTVASMPVDFGIWDSELVWIYTDNPAIPTAHMRPKMQHGESGVVAHQKVFDQNWAQGIE